MNRARSRRPEARKIAVLISMPTEIGAALRNGDAVRSVSMRICRSRTHPSCVIPVIFNALSRFFFQTPPVPAPRTHIRKVRVGNVYAARARCSWW